MRCYDSDVKTLKSDENASDEERKKSNNALKEIFGR